jgi:glucuronoarabinoxylan endo-1,4-beta-xylanase
MTEWSVERFLSVSGTYTNNDIYPSLALAKAIHTDFTTHGLNAYIYWWTSALVNNGSPAKVLWTLAQYSRFVRPGWARVNTNTTPVSNVLLSAFVNPSNNQIAVIAINLGATSQSFPLSLDTGTFGTITPYRTSASENLAKLTTIPGGTNTVQVTVPSQSVTTYTSSI